MHRLRCTWDVSRAAIVHGIFLNAASDVRWITQRACEVAAAESCYVNTFQAAHATMTTSAAPASKSPTGLVAALRAWIGASPLLCLVSRILEMRIARKKVSSC